MRRLYLSAALIFLLAGLSGLHVWHLNGFTSQLTGLLTQAQQQVRQENWTGAALLTREAKEHWMDHEGYLHTTLHHADIDAILISMDEVLAFLEGGEKQPAEYAAANARLLTQLELLVEAELPTLTNLL